MEQDFLLWFSAAGFLSYKGIRSLPWRIYESRKGLLLRDRTRKACYTSERELGGDNNNKSLTMQFRLDLFSEFPIPDDKDPDPTSE